MPSNSAAIETFLSEEIPVVDPAWTGVRSRWIVAPPSAGGWTSPPIAEWELEAVGWEDRHPHDEYVYVVEGHLRIEADGVSVILGPGDAARVHAGVTARYSAEVYARMVGVYGPNPRGEATEHGQCFAIGREQS